MKKDIIPKTIFLILAIGLIVVITITTIKSKKDMTIKLYNDICEKNIYTFSMTEESEDFKYTLVVAEKDNNLCIDALSDNDHTTTFVTNKTAYNIMHNEKQYYSFDSYELDGNIIKDGLEKINGKKYLTGTEKINGKNYYYEEYDEITEFMIWLDVKDENSSVKTRFYYDKDKIVYIKTIVNGEEEILKVEFLENVDDNLFKIPDDYVEM